MKAFLMTLLLLSVAFLAACSGKVASETAQDELKVSINSDGSCTDDFIRCYNNVVIEAKGLQESLDRRMPPNDVVHHASALKNVCNQFYSRHNNINCKVGIDNTKTKITSATHKQTCDAAHQIIESNQDSDK